MKKNPLFPHAAKAFRAAAYSEFRRSPLGQLASQLRRASRRSGPSDMARLQTQMRNLARSGNLSRQIQSSQTYRALQEVERYAKGGIRQTIMDKVFSALGPVGDLIQALFRPGGRQIADLERELEAAANMLEMFGFNVQRPGATGPTATPGGGVSPASTSTPPALGSTRPGFDPDEARRQLESLGFTVVPPDPSRSQPPRFPGQQDQGAVRPGTRDPSPSAPATPGGMLHVTVGGQRMRIRRTDPLVTGEMIPVKSSNVHSIGYIWNNSEPNKGTLKVRFLDKRSDGPASGRGAMYFYYDVHPSMFLAFQQASSKGKWVWDHLRIRGTVSGHQKRYSLASLASDGYVPRKAVRLGNEEWYLPRTVTGANGQSYRSRLKAQMVQRLDNRPGNGRQRRPGNGRPGNGRQ